MRRFGEGDERDAVLRPERRGDRPGAGHRLLPVVAQPHGIGAVEEDHDLFRPGPPHGRQRATPYERAREGGDQEGKRRQPDGEQQPVADAPP